MTTSQFVRNAGCQRPGCTESVIQTPHERWCLAHGRVEPIPDAQELERRAAGRRLDDRADRSIRLTIEGAAQRKEEQEMDRRFSDVPEETARAMASVLSGERLALLHAIWKRCEKVEAITGQSFAELVAVLMYVAGHREIGPRTMLDSPMSELREHIRVLDKWLAEQDRPEGGSG